MAVDKEFISTVNLNMIERGEMRLGKEQDSDDCSFPNPTWGLTIFGTETYSKTSAGISQNLNGSPVLRV